MTDFERQQPESPEPSELEGGGSGQTWGQGEGTHEPTIADEEDEQPPSANTGGTAADLDDPDLPPR